MGIVEDLRVHSRIDSPSADERKRAAVDLILDHEAGEKGPAAPLQQEVDDGGIGSDVDVRLQVIAVFLQEGIQDRTQIALAVRGDEGRNEQAVEDRSRALSFLARIGRAEVRPL